MTGAHTPCETRCHLKYGNLSPPPKHTTSWDRPSAPSSSLHNSRSPFLASLPPPSCALGSQEARQRPPSPPFRCPGQSTHFTSPYQGKSAWVPLPPQRPSPGTGEENPAGNGQEDHPLLAILVLAPPRSGPCSNQRHQAGVSQPSGCSQREKVKTPEESSGWRRTEKGHGKSYITQSRPNARRHLARECNVCTGRPSPPNDAFETGSSSTLCGPHAFLFCEVHGPELVRTGVPGGAAKTTGRLPGVSFSCIGRWVCFATRCQLQLGTLVLSMAESPPQLHLDGNWQGTMARPATPPSLDSENSTSSSTVLSLSDTDLAEEEEKICAVCGDRATGYHFHAMTCEGCKSFFRRTVLRGFQFMCAFTRDCTITKAKRRQCQACRYQKCLAVGMKKDMIMSEEALRVRRELQRQKRHRELSPVAGSPEKGTLTADQEQLIEILSEAYKKNIDPSFSPFTYYQTPVRLQVHSPPPHSPDETHFPPLSPHPSQDPTERYPEEVLPDVFSFLPLFADVTTYTIQQVVKFAKDIPYFRTLPVDDQISLLKGATMEITEILFNMYFDLDSETWVCGSHTYAAETITMLGFKPIYLELVLKFHVSLRKLNLNDTEYVLLQALVLFSPDDVPVVQREAVDQIQERIALTLKSYIDHRHPLPEGRFLYAKLLLLLTELRSLKVESTRQIHHMPNSQDLITMTPLLSEIIS